MLIIFKAEGRDLSLQRNVRPPSSVLSAGSGKALALQFILCGALLASNGCRDTMPDPRDPVPQARIVQVSENSGEAGLSAPGKVALKRETPVGFVTSGRVAAVLVNEGDFVRTGQVVARLDTSVLDAELQRASTELQRRTDELQRFEKLYAKGWVTRQRLEEIRAALASAAATAEAAEFNRKGATLVARGPAIVLARSAEPGQVIQSGAPVVRLGELASGFVLRVPLDDRELPRVSLGATATVRISALGNRVLAGRVTEFAGQADERTGTYVVEISLPPDPDLRSGQIGGVVIAAAPALAFKGVVMVPVEAVFNARAGQGFVYLFDRDDRRVKLQRVDLDAPSGDTIPVLQGLKPGSWVVVSSLDRLRDGMKIVPVLARE
jgi:RND family efflux transporter MFP subunit